LQPVPTYLAHQVTWTTRRCFLRFCCCSNFFIFHFASCVWL